MILSPKRCDELRRWVIDGEGEVVFDEEQVMRNLLDTVADLQRQLLEAQGQVAGAYKVAADKVRWFLDQAKFRVESAKQLGGTYVDDVQMECLITDVLKDAAGAVEWDITPESAKSAQALVVAEAVVLEKDWWQQSIDDYERADLLKIRIRIIEERVQRRAVLDARCAALRAGRQE